MDVQVKKIDRVSNCDAFDKLDWRGAKLGTLNLIYGWNGSGKSTISRIFNFVERRKIHLNDYSKIDFTIATNNNPIKKNSIASHSLNIRVFNEDFILDHLTFKESKAEKIIIPGKDAKEAAERIEQLKIEKTNKTKDLETLNKQRADKPNIDKILTNAATAVTKMFANTPLATEAYYGRSYDKRKVDRIISDRTISASNADSHIIAQQDKIETYKDIVKTERQEEYFEMTEIDDFSELFSLANNLQSENVEATGYNNLQNDNELRDWIEDGYNLHKNREVNNCLFCGNRLDSNLLEDLSKFFTKKLETVKSQIDETVTSLENLWRKDGKTSLDSGKLYPDIAVDYIAQKSIIDSESKNIQKSIDTMIDNLKKRKDDIFNPKRHFDRIKYPSQSISKYNGAISQANKLVDRHNIRVKGDSKDQEDAAKALELHTIASTLTTEKYFNLKKEIESLEANISSTKTALSNINKEIRDKTAYAQDAMIAVEKINAFLIESFGDQQISLSVTGTNKDGLGYVIKSRGKNVRYLSEGEKSILAMTYFFVKMEEEDFELENSLIVIDDPVDSQDNILLFRTFGLLKRQLCKSGQLVVLTHNYDFFNLIRDWFVGIKTSGIANLYFIKMDKDGSNRTVVVEDLPKLLREFKSEYQYLFYRIYHYNKGENRQLEEPLVANICRKILEYFAGFKWSCKTTEHFTNIVQSRFVSSDEQFRQGTGDFIVKFLHEYSHGTDFSRPVSASLLEADKIAQNVLYFIKLADEEHYKDLKKLCES